MNIESAMEFGGWDLGGLRSLWICFLDCQRRVWRGPYEGKGITGTKSDAVGAYVFFAFAV